MSTQQQPVGGSGRPWPALDMAIAAAALLVIAYVVLYPYSNMPWLMRNDHQFADYRTALLSHRIEDEHRKVAIVSITEETLRKEAALTFPLDRSMLARLIDAVAAARPSAIGLDVFFLRKTDESRDSALLESLRRAEVPIVLGAVDERVTGVTAEQRAFQTAFLAQTKRPAGYLNLFRDQDTTVRYWAPPEPGSQFPDSFALLLARTIEPGVTQGQRRIAWLQRIDPTDPLTAVANLGATSPFVNILAHDLLGQGGTEAQQRLKGKVVLIGADLPRRGDHHRTPLTVGKVDGEVPGVSIHAQMVAELIDWRRVTELSDNSIRIVLAVFAAVGFLLGWRFRYRRFDFLNWTIGTAVLITIDVFFFRVFHIILPFLVTVLAWFAGVTAGHHLGRVADRIRPRAKETAAVTG